MHIFFSMSWRDSEIFKFKHIRMQNAICERAKENEQKIFQ